MPARKLSFSIALLIALCVGAVSALAYNARIVRLSLVQGEVQIDRNVGQGDERAILNTPITAGVRLQTQDGRAEVEFENGSTVRLASDSEVVFRELSLEGNGNKVTLVDVVHGTVYFDIEHKGDDRFTIAWAGQSVSLRKSAHLRIETEGELARLAVFNGEAEVNSAGEQQKVKKGEMLTLDSLASERYEVAKGIERIEDDSWDSQRGHDRDLYANASGYGYANSAYGAPYSYGMTDMLRYGSYFDAPGYGWLWRPASFGFGWDPFDNGAWSYYPGAGYVYVSQYPWGWTPYRYGQWVFVPQYGWCWSPARHYGNWNPVPVIVNAPSGFVPLRRPDPRPGPVMFVDSRHQPTPAPVGGIRITGGHGFRNDPDRDMNRRGRDSFRHPGNDVNRQSFRDGGQGANQHSAPPTVPPPTVPVVQNHDRDHDRDRGHRDADRRDMPRQAPERRTSDRMTPDRQTQRDVPPAPSMRPSTPPAQVPRVSPAPPAAPAPARVSPGPRMDMPRGDSGRGAGAPSGGGRPHGK